MKTSAILFLLLNNCAAVVGVYCNSPINGNAITGAWVPNGKCGAKDFLGECTKRQTEAGQTPFDAHQLCMNDEDTWSKIRESNRNRIFQ